MGTKHTHTVIDLESNKVPLLLALNAEGASSVVWKELVLAQGQLLTGAAGGILQAELITIITNPAIGNTFKITDGTTTETFTFRAAWGVAFDVAIGINAAATQANLVIAVNTDSTLWKAIATTSLDTWFASLPVSQVVIARKATSANNDRIFGTQTAVDGIKVVSFLASRGYEKVFSTESNIPAVDPAVKKFGFGRAFAALVTSETHLIADLDEAWTWDSDAMLWVQTGASVIHPIGGPNHSASIVTAVESKFSDIGAGAHLGLTTHSSAANPTITNDAVDTAILGRKFRFGDTWYNTALGYLFLCIDNTAGAAIWREVNSQPYITTTSPGPGNDGVMTVPGTGRRFYIGDTWINVTTQQVFYCYTNITGAAMWLQIDNDPIAAVSNPLPTNDSVDTAVFGRVCWRGDKWLNTATGHLFECLSAAVGAAVWVQYSNQPFSSAASNPTNNNDSVDTAVLGRRFGIGDTWLNIALNTIFVCTVATPTAAIWFQLTNLPHSAAANPLLTNDGIDTAVTGRRFRIGDTWLNTTTNNLWVCVDITTNAAVWRTVTAHPHPAATNPLLTNDKVDTAVIGRYFRIGDTWRNTSTGHIFICLDDTASAAVWTQYTNQPYSSAATNPTNNNDVVDTAVLGRRFRVGDTWLNIALNTLFVCTDSTAANAVWLQITNQPWSAAGNPLFTNDGIDTAVSGRRFKVGDAWLNTTTNNLWICVTNTTNAAAWRTITSHPHSAASNPLLTNDKVDTAVTGRYFRVGDTWLNTATGHVYLCIDDTATAAVWIQYSNQPYSSAASNPTNNNDVVDTAVLGRRFRVGDTWLNIALGTLFVCVDSTATAAVWQATTSVPFSAAVDPIKTNDGIDTAVAGRRFKVGDIWLNTVTNNLWVCAANTTAAAAWRTITSHPYSSAINPVPTNDKVDTIVLGRFFRTGDTWLNTATGHVFICIDDTATAAVWRQLSNQPFEMAAVPTVLNDGVDTAAIGRRFTVGDLIRNTLLDRIYYCASSKTGGAKWLPVPQILTTTGLVTEVLPIPVVPTVERAVYSYVHGMAGVVASGYYGASYCDTLRRVYFVPFDQAAQANWHYIDCTTGNAVAYAHGMGALGVGAYADGVYDPILDRIYLVPFNQAAQATWHYINCATGAVVAYAHGAGAIGVGAYVGGTFDPIKNRIYLCPFAQAAVATWHYIDCATGNVVAYAHGMGVLGASAYDESVFDPIKQRIYLIPYAQSAQATWHYIDCTTGVVVAYAHGMVDVVASAYINGMYDPIKQRIYMSPAGQGNQATWHYINCATGAIVSYTHGMAGVVAAAYAGAAYDSVKNRIYFTPYAQSNQANWHYVDCSRGTIVAYKNDTVGILANAYVGATTDPAYDLVKNRIYFAPFAQSNQLLWHYSGLIPSVTWHKSVINPLTTNDSADTAAIGRKFSFNDIWLNSVTGQVFICTNAAVGAAVWTQFTNVPYTSAANPTNNNDVVDTAVAGRRFGVGDRWLNTVTQVMWTCTSSAAGAAIWRKYTRQPYVVASAPTVNNDSADTAAVGTRFNNGDLWLDNTVPPGTLYYLYNDAVGAAVWVALSDVAIPTLSDKNLACLVTVLDNDAASAAAITNTPALDSYVLVLVNGVQETVGDGAKNKSCYFSSDAGVTAKAIVNIAAGDRCYWVGSVAGYQLAVTDRMDWYYVVTATAATSLATRNAYDISIEAVEASQPSALLANGVRYVPLIEGNTDYIQFQFPVPPTIVSLKIHVAYHMSAANAGDVELHLDSRAFSVGSDPTQALTVGASFVVTPGNNVLVHVVDDTSHATFTQAVAPGDILVCKLQRTIGGPDTHNADMRVTSIWAES